MGAETNPAVVSWVTSLSRQGRTQVQIPQYSMTFLPGNPLGIPASEPVDERPILQQLEEAGLTERFHSTTAKGTSLCPGKPCRKQHCLMLSEKGIETFAPAMLEAWKASGRILPQYLNRTVEEHIAKLKADRMKIVNNERPR